MPTRVIESELMCRKCLKEEEIMERQSIGYGFLLFGEISQNMKSIRTMDSSTLLAYVRKEGCLK